MTERRTLLIKCHFGFVWRGLLLEGSTVVARRHGLSYPSVLLKGIKANLSFNDGAVMKIGQWVDEDAQALASFHHRMSQDIGNRTPLAEVIEEFGVDRVMAEDDSEREFHIDVVAIEVLRRATEEFQTVAEGWARLPDLTEENWERVCSRLYDLVHQLAHDLDLPAPWEYEHELPEFWNLLQWKSQQALGEGGE